MMSRTLAIATGVIVAGAGHAWAQGESILREAVGSRAHELGEMELKPFDSSLWPSLEGWTNGSPLDAAATDGKVVLIGTWASWNPSSTRMLGTMQSLHETYGEEGLLVVGVHHAQGWEGAADALTRRKAGFLTAHDASGKFREGIRADQDPDFYLIDRAGQLRFADVRNESVEDGVKLLLAEDSASAGAILSRREEQARQAEVEFGKPKLIQDSVNLASLPEVSFMDPPAELYAVAGWPAMTSDEDDRRSGRRDEDDGPSAVGLPSGGWLDGTAPVTRGRAVAYYTWTLEDARSSALCRRMDLLQQQLGRDVVVVGVLTAPESNNRRNDESDDAATLTRRANQFRRLHNIQHPILIDPGASVMEVRGRTNVKDRQLSTAMVVSSDGMLRWSGVTDGHAFRAAIDRVVEVDPGLQARRAAERAFIRARGG